MRTLTLALVGCFAATAHAQGVVGGIALDSASRAPLSCLDVALEDTAGRVVARTRSAHDGAFAVPVPDSGVYRFRFEIWYHPPTYGPREVLGPATDRIQQYLVPLRMPSVGNGPAADSAADAPSWPQDDGPRFPPALRQRGIEGGVLMQFVVDSAGGRRSDDRAGRAGDGVAIHRVGARVSDPRALPTRAAGRPPGLRVARAAIPVPDRVLTAATARPLEQPAG